MDIGVSSIWLSIMRVISSQFMSEIQEQLLCDSIRNIALNASRITRLIK
jgi:hypothetical protein